MTSSHLRATTVAATLLLAVGLAGCGSDAKAKDEQTGTASVSVTPTPTPTPTPAVTPTQAPLSAFEDKAPVKALRAWFLAEAKAVNAGQRSMSSLAALSTAGGMTLARTFSKDDVDHGYYLPGPHPFTPVSISTGHGTARVNTCLLLRGWSEHRKTHKPVRAPKVYPTVFVLAHSSGSWKVDAWSAGTADCHGVKITKVRW